MITSQVLYWTLANRELACYAWISIRDWTDSLVFNIMHCYCY